MAHFRFHFACLYIRHKNSLTYNAHTAEYENAWLLRNVLRAAGIRSGIRQTQRGFSTGARSLRLSRLIQIDQRSGRKRDRVRRRQREKNNAPRMGRKKERMRRKKRRLKHHVRFSTLLFPRPPSRFCPLWQSMPYLRAERRTRDWTRTIT